MELITIPQQPLPLASSVIDDAINLTIVSLAESLDPRFTQSHLIQHLRWLGLMSMRHPINDTFKHFEDNTIFVSLAECSDFNPTGQRYWSNCAIRMVLCKLFEIPYYFNTCDGKYAVCVHRLDEITSISYYNRVTEEHSIVDVWSVSVKPILTEIRERLDWLRRANAVADYPIKQCVNVHRKLEEV